MGHAALEAVRRLGQVALLVVGGLGSALPRSRREPLLRGEVAPTKIPAAAQDGCALAATGTFRACVVALHDVGFRALPLVAGVALLATLTLQLELSAVAATSTGGGRLLGQLWVLAVLREAAPLVTALIVTSRSVAACATELAGMRAGGQLAVLEAFEVPLGRLLVLPRLVGMLGATLTLSVVFAGVAFATGALVLGAGESGPGAFLAGVAETLRPGDPLLLLLKSTLLGLGLGAAACHYGLVGRRDQRPDVPAAAGRAVLAALAWSALASTALTGAFYQLVGGPWR